MNDEFNINQHLNSLPNKEFLTNPLIKTELVNQAKLIVKGFGLGIIKPKFYNVTSDLNKTTLEELAREEGKDGSYNGDFGLPVFDILTFIGTNYNTPDGKIITLETTSFGTALMEVSQCKNIVRTPVQGRNGDVFEYCSDGNYSIQIRGVLTSNGQDVYPTELAKQLISFCQAPVSFAVASTILKKFGVQQIIITDFSFPQLEGMRNVVPFNLQCLSETPFEIKSQTQGTNNSSTQAFL